MCQVLFRIPQNALIGIVLVFGAAMLLFGFILLKQRRPALGPIVGGAVVIVLALTHGWVWTALPESIPIYGFGAMLFLAFVSCTWLAGVLSQREGIAFERIQDLSLWVFVCGIIGARILFVIWFHDNFDSPLQWFAIWDGGLVFYGGFFGGIIGFFLAHYAFLRKYHISRWKLADIIAPCLALGLCLGRVGCLLNGCCYGNVACEQCPAIHFPLSAPPRDEFVKRGLQTAAGFTMNPELDREVGAVEPDSQAARAGLRRGDIIEGVNGKPVETYNQMLAEFARWPRGKNDLVLEVRHAGSKVSVTLPAFESSTIGLHPTQVYESISMGLLVLVLLSFYAVKKWDGMVLVVFMAAYAVHRFLNEMLRTDTKPVAFDMTLSQNLSILVLAAAAVLFFLVPKQTQVPTNSDATPLPPETGNMEAGASGA